MIFTSSASSFYALIERNVKAADVYYYYANYLNVTHRKDLAKKDLEAIWIQAKFPSTNVLFSVIYRSELYSPNFFTNLQDVMEKAWMKTDNIVLLRDLNCNLLRVNECSSFSDLQTKTRNLLHIFDVFNMQNVIKEATRITPSTETLIDVIATNKPELVRTTGVLPLGITDHSLVYATLRLIRKRPPPTVITVRNFKQFNTENFKAVMERTPFYIASVFDDMDDILWAWNQLFRGVCNSHAPPKEIKVRSVSSPWINNTIRLKMNRRFKLFKRAVETKDQNTWAD